MKGIIDTMYMIGGMGIILLTISVGMIGIIKVWREINKLKDTEEQMEYTNPTYWELGMSCIVLIGYIVGKVWIHYKVEDNPNTKGTKKGLIKRGPEWDL